MNAMYLANLATAFDAGYSRAVMWAAARFGEDDRRTVIVGLAYGALIDGGVEGGVELLHALNVAYDIGHEERLLSDLRDLPTAGARR
jgi:phage-related minor tail protein